MNKIGIFNLRNRIAADSIITAGLTLSVLRSFIKNLSACIAEKNFDTESITQCIYSFAGFSALFTLTLIFWDIHKKDSPFCQSVIVKLRVLAAVFFCIALIPVLFASAAEVFTSAGNTASLFISYDFWLLLLAGLIIGIISEIFVYGKELQEDNDTIA